MPSPTVELTTRLNIPAAAAWEHATGFSGINAELWPYLRMTHPRGPSALTQIEFIPGRRLFRSWLLAFGFLPIDYDDIMIAEVVPGRSFRESSRMLSAATWEHERTITACDEQSCEVTDRVSYQPRWRVMAPVLGVVVPRLFAHRHARLARLFGHR